MNYFCRVLPITLKSNWFCSWMCGTSESLWPICLFRSRRPCHYGKHILTQRAKCHMGRSSSVLINYTGNLWTTKCHPETSHLTGLGRDCINVMEKEGRLCQQHTHKKTPSQLCLWCTKANTHRLPLCSLPPSPPTPPPPAPKALAPPGPLIGQWQWQIWSHLLHPPNCLRTSDRHYVKINWRDIL